MVSICNGWHICRCRLWSCCGWCCVFGLFFLCCGETNTVSTIKPAQERTAHKHGHYRDPGHDTEDKHELRICVLE